MVFSTSAMPAAFPECGGLDFEDDGFAFGANLVTAASAVVQSSTRDTLGDTVLGAVTISLNLSPPPPITMIWMMVPHPPFLDYLV